MKCPCCEGKGNIAKPDLIPYDRKLKAQRRNQARKLRKMGFSLNIIMKALGYKSPRSVVLAINRKD